MPSKLRLNLISKINLLGIALILMTSSGIAAFAVWGENKHMAASMRTQYELMSFMIADNCEYGIYTQDIGFLERTLRSLSADGNLARIAVFDDKFKPLIVKKLKAADSAYDFYNERPPTASKAISKTAKLRFRMKPAE